MKSNKKIVEIITTCSGNDMLKYIDDNTNALFTYTRRKDAINKYLQLQPPVAFYDIDDDSDIPF